MTTENTGLYRMLDAKGDYSRRHYRVKAARGQARHYRCRCGRQAAHWSQTHGTTGDDPADYVARCVRCHVRYDRPELGPVPPAGPVAPRYRCTGPCNFCWPPLGTTAPDLINQTHDTSPEAQEQYNRPAEDKTPEGDDAG